MFQSRQWFCSFPTTFPRVDEGRCSARTYNVSRNRLEQGMKSVDRRFDEKIDQEILVAMLKHYVVLPKAERLKSYDKFFGLTNTQTELWLVRLL